MFILQNDQFPILYTASNADLVANPNAKFMYPIVHAILCSREFDNKRKLCVRFDVIGDHNDEKISIYKKELIKAIYNEYKISGLIYEIKEGKFYVVNKIKEKLIISPYQS